MDSRPSKLNGYPSRRVYRPRKRRHLRQVGAVAQRALYLAGSSLQEDAGFVGGQAPWLKRYRSWQIPHSADAKVS